MDELISIVKSGQTVCLLCFERDKDCCHRSRIAEIVTSAPAPRSSISSRRCSERGYSAGCGRSHVALDAVDQKRNRRRAEHEAERDHRRHRQHQIEAAAAVQERDHADRRARDHDR